MTQQIRDELKRLRNELENAEKAHEQNEAHTGLEWQKTFEAMCVARCALRDELFESAEELLAAADREAQLREALEPTQNLLAEVAKYLLGNGNPPLAVEVNKYRFAVEAALSASLLPATPTPIRIDPDDEATWPDGDDEVHLKTRDGQTAYALFYRDGRGKIASSFNEIGDGYRVFSIDEVEYYCVLPEWREVEK